MALRFLLLLLAERQDGLKGEAEGFHARKEGEVRSPKSEVRSWGKNRNSKSEIRKKSETRNPKSEKRGIKEQRGIG
jgi:hypothetical protein